MVNTTWFRFDLIRFRKDLFIRKDFLWCDCNRKIRRKNKKNTLGIIGIQFFLNLEIDELIRSRWCHYFCCTINIEYFGALLTFLAENFLMIFNFIDLFRPTYSLNFTILLARIFIVFNSCAQFSSNLFSSSCFRPILLG